MVFRLVLGVLNKGVRAYTISSDFLNDFGKRVTVKQIFSKGRGSFEQFEPPMRTGMFLYNADPWDSSKLFTLHPLADLTLDAADVTCSCMC